MIPEPAVSDLKHQKINCIFLRERSLLPPVRSCSHKSTKFRRMTTAAMVRVTFGGILLLTTVPLKAEWNWQSPLPQGNSLRDVQFIDASNGWAVGEYGTVVHTTNGGLSWYEQEFARTDNILAISMISADEGWAAGDNGVILHTTDAGAD